MSKSAQAGPSNQRRKPLTVYPDKSAVAIPVPNQQANRAWLNFLLVILLTATMLPLAGGADGIHCVAGIMQLEFVSE